MSTETLEALAQRSPWTVIAESLALEAQGKPISDEMKDATVMAAVLLTALALRQGGASDGLLEELFDERDFVVKLAYSGESCDMSCSIEWPHGGEQCTVTGHLESGDSGPE